MKIRRSVLAGLAVCGVVLSGCGKKEEAPAPEPPAAPGAAQAQAPALTPEEARKLEQIQTAQNYVAEQQWDQAAIMVQQLAALPLTAEQRRQVDDLVKQIQEKALKPRIDAAKAAVAPKQP